MHPLGKQRGQHLPQGVGYLIGAGGRVGRIPKLQSEEPVLRSRPCTPQGGTPPSLRLGRRASVEVAWDLSLWSSPKFSFNPNPLSFLYPRRLLSLLFLG